METVVEEIILTPLNDVKMTDRINWWIMGSSLTLLIWHFLFFFNIFHFCWPKYHVTSQVGAFSDCAAMTWASYFDNKTSFDFLIATIFLLLFTLV